MTSGYTHETSNSKFGNTPDTGHHTLNTEHRKLLHIRVCAMHYTKNNNIGFHFTLCNLGAIYSNHLPQTNPTHNCFLTHRGARPPSLLKVHANPVVSEGCESRWFRQNIILNTRMPRNKTYYPTLVDVHEELHKGFHGGHEQVLQLVLLQELSCVWMLWTNLNLWISKCPNLSNSLAPIFIHIVHF